MKVCSGRLASALCRSGCRECQRLLYLRRVDITHDGDPTFGALNARSTGVLLRCRLDRLLLGLLLDCSLLRSAIQPSLSSWLSLLSACRAGFRFWLLLGPPLPPDMDNFTAGRELVCAAISHAKDGFSMPALLAALRSLRMPEAGATQRFCALFVYQLLAWRPSVNNV